MGNCIKYSTVVHPSIAQRATILCTCSNPNQYQCPCSIGYIINFDKNEICFVNKSTIETFRHNSRTINIFTVVPCTNVNFLENYYMTIAKHRTIRFQATIKIDTLDCSYDPMFLSKLPSNITHIIFESKFNNQIILNHRIKHLEIWNQYTAMFELSKNLEFLSLGHDYNHQLILTKNLEYIMVGFCYQKPIHFNKYLTNMQFNVNDYSLTIMTSKYLKILRISHYSGTSINFNKKLKKLSFCTATDQHIVLSKNIINITLNFRTDYNHQIVLPKYLVKLSIGLNFKQPLILPKTIVYFDARYGEFTPRIILEHPMYMLSVTRNCNRQLTDELPNGLVLFNNYDLFPCDNFPSGTKNCDGTNFTL